MEHGHRHPHAKFDVRPQKPLWTFVLSTTFPPPFPTTPFPHLIINLPLYCNHPLHLPPPPPPLPVFQSPNPLLSQSIDYDCKKVFFTRGIEFCQPTFVLSASSTVGSGRKRTIPNSGFLV
jgi:hypothetical protein